MKINFNKVKLAFSALAVMLCLNTAAQKKASAPTKKHRTTRVAHKRQKISILKTTPWKSSNLLANASDVATKTSDMQDFTLLKEFAKYRTNEFIEKAYDNFVEAASTESDKIVYKMYNIKNKKLHCAETTRKILEKTMKDGNFTELNRIFKGFNNSAPGTAKGVYDLCSQGGTCPDFKAQIQKEMAESELNGGIWLVMIKSPNNRTSSGYHVFTVVAKDGVAYKCNFNRTWIKNLEEVESKEAIVINVSRELYDEIINQHMSENNILPLNADELKYVEQKENEQNVPINIREENKEIAQAEQRVRNRLAALLLQNSQPADLMAQQVVSQANNTSKIDVSSFAKNSKERSLS